METNVVDVNGRKFFKPPQAEEKAPSSCTSELLCSVPDGAIHIGWFCPGSKRFCYTDEKQAWPVSRQAFTVPVYAIPQAPNRP